MHVHHPVYPREIRPPYLFQEPFPGEDHPRMLGQGEEEVKFQLGKGKGLALQVGLPLLGKKAQGAIVELFLEASPPEEGLGLPCKGQEDGCISLS